MNTTETDSATLGQRAISELEERFGSKEAPAGDGPLVGVFGNGLPPALVAASGCRLVDVMMVPDEQLGVRAPALDAYLEPFLDEYTALFLNRLSSGCFDSFDAIIFPRDESAALTAYQYALEFARQGIGSGKWPALILWNLIHGRSDAIKVFNLKQANTLTQQLEALGGHAPDAKSIAAAAADERDRAMALAALAKLVEERHISGGEAMRWRNAGRYAPAAEHAYLLREAGKAAASPTAVREGFRIGLIGTALSDARVYATIERFGTVVCDLQPFGQVWPAPTNLRGAFGVPALVEAEASDPLNPRAPDMANRQDKMAGSLMDAQCDLVVSQYDQNDDSFGWELPALRDRLHSHGVPVLDLGFRDVRPDNGWLASAQAALSQAFGVSHV